MFRTRRSRASRAVVATALVLAGTLALAGCSGHGKSAPSTPAATPTPTPAVASPGDLKSYRYAIALTVAGGALGGVPTTAGQAPDTQAGAGTPAPSATPATFTIDINGEVVNPDREHSETKARLGFIELTVERVEIGGTAWTREAGGAWKRATPGGSSAASLGANIDISPARLFAQNGATFTTLNKQLGELPSQEDAVDGMKARRYDLSADEFQRIFSGTEGLLPGDTRPVQTSGAVWIGDESHVPLRMRLDSRTTDGKPAFEMDMKLSDLNGNFAIAPPAS